MEHTLRNNVIELIEKGLRDSKELELDIKLSKINRKYTRLEQVQTTIRGYETALEIYRKMLNEQ